jgi:splicing factor 3B subunit 3
VVHAFTYSVITMNVSILHKIQVDGLPLGLYQFQSHLLVGIRQVLRIYDLGKRKLLRKCENNLFPNTIVYIHTYGDRIYVGDIQVSFHYVKYRHDENQLYIFADDGVSHWLT